LNRRGVDTSTDARQAALAVECDTFGLLRAGVAAGLPDITSTSFAAGVGKLGTTLPSAVVYASRWEPGRHYGVAAWRPSKYDRGGDRYVYSGPLRHL
jgi:hypothetical protein